MLSACQRLPMLLDVRWRHATSRGSLVDPVRPLRRPADLLGFILRGKWSHHHAKNRRAADGCRGDVRRGCANLDGARQRLRFVVGEERGELYGESGRRPRYRSNGFRRVSRGRDRRWGGRWSRTRREGIARRAVIRERHGLIESLWSRPEAIPGKEIPEVFGSSGDGRL